MCCGVDHVFQRQVRLHCSAVVVSYPPQDHLKRSANKPLPPVLCTDGVSAFIFPTRLHHSDAEPLLLNRFGETGAIRSVYSAVSCSRPHRVEVRRNSGATVGDDRKARVGNDCFRDQFGGSLGKPSGTKLRYTLEKVGVLPLQSVRSIRVGDSVTFSD